ncbi:hypothetical protein ACIP1G_05075 [Pseudomonas sp. NPDC089392]|uniref:hypothetical protein n=1 Tax=Pseudomonas sp. NPDC089392 TaxID=3364459 RepID=UPI003802A24E
MDKLLRLIFTKLDSKKWVNCGERTPNSVSCVHCQQSQYYNGNKISYSCVEKRKIYALRYLPVHEAENRSALRKLPDDVVQELLNYNNIRVLSLGGGPGSDLYAVLKYLSESVRDGYRHKVSMTRIDIEPLWDKMAGVVVEDAAAGCDFEIVNKVIHADVMAGLDSVKGKEYDLVICSYLISELSGVNFKELGGRLKKIMWKGGVLMINDRPQDEVDNNIREIFEGAEIELEEASNNGHANYYFDQDIVDKVGPKFYMGSNFFLGVNK